ncbi:MAG: HK97 family phage prohead protease, partial [Candidatus Binatia bacterium]
MRSTAEILKNLRSKPIVRTFQIDRRSVNADARTVNLAFASGRPVDQWFGRLSLTMTAQAMKADRLKRGAPLLMDHNPVDQIGVVQDYSIGNDGVARATVRFGESARAQETFRDVETGIRQNVSVGFMVHEMHLEDDGRKSDRIPTYRSDSWTPFEVSIVSIPSDISVGIGRGASVNFGENKMDTPDSEVTNAQEIVDFADIFGEKDLARKMIIASPAATLDDVRLAIKAKQTAAHRGQRMPE